MKRLLKLKFNMDANDNGLEVVLTFFSNMATLNIHAMRQVSAEKREGSRILFINTIPTYWLGG